MGFSCGVLSGRQFRRGETGCPRFCECRSVGRGEGEYPTQEARRQMPMKMMMHASHGFFPANPVKRAFLRRCNWLLFSCFANLEGHTDERGESEKPFRAFTGQEHLGLE